MSAGIVASRYATALLKLVDETGSGETVIRQAQTLKDALASMPELRRAINDSKSVTSAQKINLFESVFSGSETGETLAPELKKFLELLIKNQRISDCDLILNSFVALYYKSRGIIRGKLVFSSEKDSPESVTEFVTRIKNMVESKTGKQLLLATSVDESLIGGFVLEIEDQLMDASVARQLDIIKRQFIERNRRIV